jgi:2-polyprenyl-3-methyl-5-hydroxy-6-metoxy-1,4-benzoquinol methylase
LGYGAVVQQDLSNRVGNAAERFVPGQGRGELMEAQHVARYWWAAGLVGQKRVLDAGCGVGYGSAMLAAAGAEEVIGIDIARAAVAGAEQVYPGVAFAVADVRALPFDDGRFDVVVCFEVIEHLNGQPEVIAELARVLAPDGVLAISSPNRGVYPEGNPHHVHEYTSDELATALAQHFSHVELRRQHDWLASAILDDAQVGDQRVADLGVDVGKVWGPSPAAETYTIALAGRAALPNVGARLILAGADELRQSLVLGAGARRVEAERDRLRADLRRTQAQLDSERSALLGELEQVRETLRRIHNSRLWRLSKPLRELRRWRR